MKFNKKCNNCNKNEISIIKIFFIIHDILDNKITCKNCKLNFQIKDKSLKKYNYSIIFLALIYLVGFFYILLIVGNFLGTEFGLLGVIMGLLFIFIIEYIISRKITLIN